MPANAVPASLVISGSSRLVLTNILVGDVWLISGQSNADFPLKSAEGGKAAIAAATNHLLRWLHLAESPGTSARAFTAAELARLNARDYFSGAWRESRPENVADISAIGFFFARRIQSRQGVPVGLIDCTVGGTPAESWIPPEAQAANPRLQAMANDFLKSERVAEFAKKRLRQNLAAWDAAGRPAPMPDHPYRPGICWRFGLEPLVPFAIRGVLWYQGETNADFAEPSDFDRMAQWHVESFQTLLDSWRNAWRRPDLPFYCVQLPRLNRPSWPWFRESQARSVQGLTHVALAMAWEFGEANNVHPTKKEPVAERLALIARALSYGEKVEWSGPLYRRHRVEGSRIVVEFDHAESGLVSKDHQPLRLFEIAGADRRFYPAIATIEGNTVRIAATNVARPETVRYAWVADGNLNFYNGAGLPAFPFRTDQWAASP